jgi:hypothetical protein
MASLREKLIGGYGLCQPMKANDFELARPLKKAPRWGCLK